MYVQAYFFSHECAFLSSMILFNGQKCGGLTAKYATRTALWLAEMHKARGQFRDAASVLFRASMVKVEGGQGVSLRAGVLLEQAAYCYLRVSPSMLRKFGFHLVLAGNRYTVCSQVCSNSYILVLFSAIVQYLWWWNPPWRRAAQLLLLLCLCSHSCWCLCLMLEVWDQ